MLLSNKKQASFDIDISEIKNTDASFSCRVTTENVEGKKAFVTVRLELLDSSNNIINYHFKKINFAPYMKDTFKISIPVKEKIYGYRAYVADENGKVLCEVMNN